jgi:hypothetical protein
MHYQYYNSNALLLVNPKGKIRVLYTPFKVTCISNESGLRIGSFVYVDEILCDAKDQLYYSINGQTYLYSCFLVRVLF